MKYKQGLERNLKLYILLGLFRKKTYLAVITIYAITYAGLSVEQLGIIAAITAGGTLLMEIPSGYLSDKIGHKKAIILASIFTAIAPLGFVVSVNFYGVLFASMVYFVGGAFYSGTTQAFLHETLAALNRKKDYSRVMFRVQRWGLVGNIFLVALVPLTYKINPQAPFVAGALLQGLLVIVSLLLTTPQKQEVEIKDIVKGNFLELLKVIYKRKEMLLFFFLGIAAALHNRIPEYKELYFQDIGVPMWVFGFVYSFMSIIGILATYHMHKVEKYRARYFFLIDFLIACTVCILVGVVSNPIVGIGIFIVLGGYYRVRRILIDSYLLRDCPTQNLKATYLSTYQFFGSIHSIWVPIFLGYTIGRLGVQEGYLVFGSSILIPACIIYTIIYRKK